MLREILEHKKNALLVHPENIDEWALALDFLLNDSGFANHLGSCAHNDYKNKHTWAIRAKHILEAAASL